MDSEHSAQTRLYSERVLLVEGDGVLSLTPALITIEGPWITHVERVERARLPDLSIEQPITDLGDRLLTPAFINSHTHLSMSAFRGVGLEAMAGNVVEDLYFRLESALTAEDVRAFTRVSAYECLLNGTATVVDHYYEGLAVAAGLADVGLCGLVAPTLQDLDGPGVGQLDAAWAATFALAEETRWSDAGIAPVLGPHATDTVSDDLWRRIAETAEAQGWPVHLHIAQSFEELARSRERHGLDPVSRLHGLGVLDGGPKWLMVHGQLIHDAERTLLDPARHVLGHCPWSQVQFAFPAPVGRWLAEGFEIAVGTDCGACNDTMNVQQDLRLVAGGSAYGLTDGPEAQRFYATGQAETALLAARSRRFEETERVRRPDTLLSMITTTPGALHPKLPLGQIAPGQRACLCLWDPEHPALWPGRHLVRALAYCDSAPALLQVMSNGRWIGERGRFSESVRASEGFQAAVEEAGGRLTALLARVGLGSV